MLDRWYHVSVERATIQEALQPTIMSIKEQFKVFANFCETHKIPFAVAGAFALHGYGYTRATSDLDFVVTAKSQAALIQFLESLGYETVASSQGFSHHIHVLQGARIDLIYVEADTADKMFASVTRIALFEDLELPVVSPLHLVAIKLFAIKNDPTRKLKDLADIRELLERTAVDMAKVRDCFAHYGFEEYFSEVSAGEQRDG